MKAKRVLTKDDLDHLPTPVHKRVARHLIQTGEWAIAAATSGHVDIREI
jgi:hypothetical protein